MYGVPGDGIVTYVFVNLHRFTRDNWLGKVAVIPAEVSREYKIANGKKKKKNKKQSAQKGPGTDSIYGPLYIT